MEITSKTKLYCIFGNPVAHSLSPVMHNAGFAAAGLDALYCAFEVNEIGRAVEAMRTLGIAGASVTIPFKVDVMKYIDEADILAEDIGAVNTLLNKDGIIKGFNTDGTGACAAITESGMRLESSSALVIGNGGAAKAVAWSLLFNGCGVMLTGRNAERVSALAGELGKKYGGVSVAAALTPEYTKNFDIIINTTPVGMEGHSAGSLPAGFDSELLHAGQRVFDIVYKPGKTRLLELASARGCKTIRGFEMLINQGIEQFKIWTGQNPPKDVMREAAEKYLYEDQYEKR
ncbi:MAG: shikimate dehydrogenase [Spirochaetia bacterium]|jgi:shikimate dehydrogenase|nr:shikimate dehydrogenase [Spirochaetia bacterium]